MNKKTPAVCQSTCKILATRSADFYEGYYHARPVPEPGTLILLGTGILILLAFGRQKMLKHA